MANWWWIWGKLTIFLFFFAESAHGNGFLKVRELPCWAFAVFDLTGRNPKAFLTTKTGQSLKILGRMKYSQPCHRVFLPRTSCDLLGTRNVCLEAPRHTMDKLLWRHQKSRSWGVPFVSVTIYNVFDPSTSFSSTEQIHSDHWKGRIRMTGEISLGAKNSSSKASDTFSLLEVSMVCCVFLNYLFWSHEFCRSEPEEAEDVDEDGWGLRVWRCVGSDLRWDTRAG